MFRILAFLCALTFSLSPAFSQLPSKVDDLIQRAEKFRALIAAGNRAKAVEFVVPSGRNDFLNNPLPALQNSRTAGLDFVNESEVHVRIEGKSTVAATGVAPQSRQIILADVWVWEKNNWYFKPMPPRELLSDLFGGEADTAHVVEEIESSFKLLTDVIEVGQLAEGERRHIRVPFEYTGSVPIRLEAKSEGPVIAIDAGSTRSLSRTSKDFGVWIGSDDFSGPFDSSLVFTIFYKNIAIDRRVSFKGVILSPFSYRQIPDVVPKDSKADFQLVIRNNTNEAVQINAVFTDARFSVNDYPAEIPPGAEGTISLRRTLTAAQAGSKIEVNLKKPVNGREIYEFKIH
jgi:hypothetical protein